MDIEKFERSVESKEKLGIKKARESDRRTKRLATVDELSLHNRRCHKKAGEIKRKVSRSHHEETMILLGRTEEKAGHMAAKVNTNQTTNTYSENVRYSVINFYFLSDEEAQEVQANPFAESTGVEEVGLWVGQEKAYDIYSSMGSGGSSENFKRDADSWAAGKPFDPIGAIRRYRIAKNVSATLDQFRRSLDMIETAIADPNLNQVLVELSRQRAGEQQAA